MLEQAFQTKVIDYLEDQGAYVIKTVVCTRSGIPDLIFCYKGIFFALELKTGSKLSKLQERNISEINKAGGHAMQLNYTPEWEISLQEFIYKGVNNVESSLFQG